MRERNSSVWVLFLLSVASFNFLGTCSRILSDSDRVIWLNGAIPKFHITEHRFAKESNPREALILGNNSKLFFKRPPKEKRALTMFARWDPISSLGKYTSPKRLNALDTDDLIATETRGRMLGQPLRWG